MEELVTNRIGRWVANLLDNIPVDDASASRSFSGSLQWTYPLAGPSVVHQPKSQRTFQRMPTITYPLKELPGHLPALCFSGYAL